MRSRWAWIGIALVWAGHATAHEGNPSRFSYRKHLRPIFATHCGGCHYEGGAGPMSLLDYDSAVPWANAIKMQVLGNQMPPWLPADGVGSFRHSRSLSPEEVDTIVDWVVGLTPEGDPFTAEELAASDAAEGWEMDEPDLILSPADAIVIGEDDYELAECVVLPTGLDQARTLTMLELRPDSSSLVRRATIGLGEDCTSAKPLATWLPGQGSVALAHQLPQGAELAMEILYVKGWEDEGKRLTDRSELGLRFSDDVVPSEQVQSVHVSAATYAVEAAIELVALLPDAADPAEIDGPIRVDLVSPEGTIQPLLVIEQYAPQWREKYVLSQPLRLAAGSTLRFSQTTAWIEFIPALATPAE